MMGDLFGPGGSGYFDFEPWVENNPARSRIATPPKMARLQLGF